MTTKKELTALRKEFKAMDKKLEKLLKAIEQGKTKAAKASKAKAPKKKSPAAKKTTKTTATDKVLSILNRSKKGVDTAALMKKTGFNQKKITNILHRTFKAGKIKRVDKGIYVGVKEG